MKRTVSFLLPLVLAGCFGPAVAQPALREGRSCIEISIGLWTQASARSQLTTDGTVLSASAGSLSGELSYHYGIRDQVFLNVGVSVIRAEANANVGLSGESQEAGTVIPLQFGVRYWFVQPEEYASMDVFVQGSIGPVFGLAGRNTLFLQETRTETAMGGRISAGIDLFTSRSFKIGLQAGVLLMTDFARSVGLRRNFNGADLSLGVAFLWGAGRTNT